MTLADQLTKHTKVEYHQKGFHKGENQKAKNIAMNMLRRNIDFQLIAEMTELDISEVIHLNSLLTVH